MKNRRLAFCTDLLHALAALNCCTDAARPPTREVSEKFLPGRHCGRIALADGIDPMLAVLPWSRL
jgi:hypothetical protein